MSLRCGVAGRTPSTIEGWGRRDDIPGWRASASARTPRRKASQEEVVLEHVELEAETDEVQQRLEAQSLKSEFLKERVLELDAKIQALEKERHELFTWKQENQLLHEVQRLEAQGLKNENAKQRLEVQDLKSENERLDSDNVECWAKIADLEEKLRLEGERCASVIDEHQRILQEKQEALNHLGNHQDLKRERENLDLAKQALGAKIEALETQLRWESEKREELLTWKQETGPILYETQQALNKVSMEHLELARENKTLESVKVDLDAKVEDLETRLLRQELVQESQRGEHETVETVKMDLNAKIEELETKLSCQEVTQESQRHEYEALESVKVELDAKIEDLETKLSCQELAQETQRREYEALELVKVDLDAKVEDLETKLLRQELVQKSQRCEHETVETVKMDLNAKIEELETKLSCQELAQESQRREYEALELVKVDLDAKIKDLKTQILRQELVQETPRRGHETLESVKGDLNAKIELLESKLLRQELAQESQRQKQEGKTWVMRDGYISGGKQLCTQIMTIAEAKLEASNLLSCTGFYYQGERNKPPEAKYNIIFCENGSVVPSCCFLYTSVTKGDRAADDAKANRIQLLEDARNSAKRMERMSITP